MREAQVDPRRAPIPNRGHPLLRRIRATFTLVVIALGLGLILAGAVGGIAYAITAALHHAANS